MSRLDFLNTLFLLGTLLLAAVLVPLHVAQSGFRPAEWLLCLVMFVSVGLAVTAGYHRLFSHRTYQAGPALRFLLLCLGAAAFENSALRWASDHRLHHRFVDTDRDPYAVRKGFWHAHWIWVMERAAQPLQGVADLEKDSLVRWQHRHPFLIGGLVSILPLGIGLFVGDVWGFFVVAVLLRIVLTHHATFLINSAAHWFGSQPYTDANTARDNPLLAPLTFGEGYHNFHHMWPGDYRNGIRWWQFDLTKWLLGVLAWVGLVRGLRRVPEATIRRARLAMEERRLRERLAKAASAVPESVHLRLAAAHARLDRALAAFHEARETRTAEWKTAFLEKRTELREAWGEWKTTRGLVKHLV